MRVRPLEIGLVLLWCCTTLLACPEPEADVAPPQQSVVCDAQGNLVQKTPPSVPPFCYDNVAYGPDDERLHRCFSRERPVCGPFWRRGEPTPAGSYDCTCNVPGSRDEAYLTVVVDIPDAGNCESALETACPFDPLEPAACKQPGVGGCAPVRGEPGRWTCQCEGGGQLQVLRDDACSSALALTCPTP